MFGNIFKLAFILFFLGFFNPSLDLNIDFCYGKQVPTQETQQTQFGALLEPEDGKVYHGACLMTYESSGDPIGPYLNALNDNSIQPAVRSFFFGLPGERGPANTYIGLQNFFHASDSIGFIPELSLFLIGKEGATDSIIAVSNKYDNIIDSIISLCKAYKKKFFLRIGGEFNGAGPGWNGGGYHPYLYVTMFKKIVDKFTKVGLRDSIAVNWCYEPDAANDFDSVDTRGARWYPGDNYVDWFGLDVFDPEHFDQRLPDYSGRNITKKGKSERFLAYAREKRKPVFLSETSAKGINISADNQDGINDWNNWFAKFWEFIDVHKEIKGFNYINANWPESAYPKWGDARIQNSPLVTQKYKEEMKKGKYIHLFQNISQNGPWNNPLMMSFSEDGISFGEPKTFQDSAGVPSVIKWKGDTLIAVFQWFRAPINSITWDKVAVKYSYDNGLSWTNPLPIQVSNLPANYQRPFDPTLAVVDKNKLRIYFSSGENQKKGLDSTINTYSAISSDGLNYTFEPSPRYDNKEKAVIDPALIFFKNEWHYISPAGAPQDGAFHCVSSDGLNFTEKPKITSDNAHNWTGNFMVENESELRFYGSGANIWLSKTSDAYNWEPYINTNIRGGDPSTVKLSTNNYLMIYVGQPKGDMLPPPKVALFLPTNNTEIKTTPIKLSWQKFPQILNFHLQISLNSNLSRPIISDTSLTDTVFTFNNLQNDSTYYWRVKAKNEKGWGPWSDVWKFTYKTSSDIQEFEYTNNFSITPNPASDYIEISYSPSIKRGLGGVSLPNIEIFNIFGEMVEQTSLSVQKSQTGMSDLLKIDISNLPAGVYFVRIGNKFEKFIKW